MADISKIKIPDGNIYNLKDMGALRSGSVIMSTNPFRGTLPGLYISKIDNALYCADMRWKISCNLVSTGGSKTVAWGNLFDGSYETVIQIPYDDGYIFTIDFTQGPEATGVFPEYPYGDFFVSFYYTGAPKSVSARMYNTYSVQGVGWHDLEVSKVNTGRNDSNLYKFTNGYYGMKYLEITVMGKDTGTTGDPTKISQVELYLSRPAPQRNPFLSKYAAEKLYYNLTAPKFIGALQGNADSATNAGTVNNHTVNSDVPANADMTAYTGTGLITVSNHQISTTAEVNQNAFSNVKVGSTTVAADTKTDTLELAGSNVTLTPDATNDKVTIGITSSNVTTALGFTPYNSTNPNGYTKVESSTNGKIKINGTNTTVYTHPGSGTNPHGTTAADVGAIPTSSKGAASGVAELDANGLVPTSQLPSFVDDVLEYSSKSAFPATGETGKIYVALNTNLTYRWSGTAYVEISPSLALGETSSTAYRGDRGKIAYDHSQSTHARTDATAVSFTRNLTSGTKVGTITINGTGTDLYCQTNTDTKNTAGSTDTSSKIFLIGATSQAANPQTYSQDTAYVGTDGCLYSGGTKVLTAHQDISGKVSKTGDKMSGTLTISTGSASFGEGVRINLSSSGYSTLLFGAPSSSTSGTADGAYWVGTGSNANYKRKLYIGHNGSTQSKTYFYADSSSQQTPNLRVGGDVFITPSNADTGCKMQYNSTTESLDFVFA